MAYDRFIHFENKRPVKDAVEAVIKAYFGEWPGEMKWESDRFFIDIPGKPSNPVHRQERFIEVHLGHKSIDVITRQADHLVNFIADGLWRYLAHGLYGTCEE